MCGLSKDRNYSEHPPNTPVDLPQALKDGVRTRSFSAAFQILFSGSEQESRSASLYSVNTFSLPLRYRKIPGDKCQGGVNPVREVKDLKKKCTSNFLSPEKQVC